MKNLKMKDLKKMSREELKKKLNELNTELMKEKAQSAIKAAVKNPGRIRAVRRTIARIKTLLRVRNLS